jgi:HD superfamily phosphohydrolase
MAKHLHEIREPVHEFIRLESMERKVLDSPPFQRLRYIHQLALTYLVYPGATHRRFEHSLGVMELAGRVYDVVTNPANIVHESVRKIVPPPGSHESTYWRRALRMAALCHDIGHLPFSHAAERELLPDGWDHERLTVQLIRAPELAAVWRDIKVQADDVAKIAVGPQHCRDAPFTVWEAILAEIITGNAFGVDRMDYLLRDSHHAGVAYGRFDHYRLIDTLRILPKPTGDGPAAPPGRATAGQPTGPASGPETGPAGEPTLGVTEGGLHSADALLLARYFMYTQVYFHPVRRVYDKHLQAFLQTWLPGGKFATATDDHLKMTDNEVMAAILHASRTPDASGHDPARRIVEHDHYRLLYQRNPDDIAQNPEAARAIFEAARSQFTDTDVYYDQYRERKRGIDFPVLAHDGRVVASLALSDVLQHVPVVAVDYVFVAPEVRDTAERWLQESRPTIIAPPKEAD